MFNSQNRYPGYLDSNKWLLTNLFIFEGNRNVDLNPINFLFSYSNLTTPVVVGDSQAQLLATIPKKGKAGDYDSRCYEKIRYLPLLSNTITDIHISIRDDQGE